jgi:sulfhydrogenase subunit delta
MEEEKTKIENSSVLVAPETKTRKPRLAIVSLTSCEGCQFALLDLGERFFDFISKVDLIDFRLIEDEEDPGGHLDVVLVEGNPVTEDNVKLLLKARERSKILAALGNCAAMGGVPEIKNYQEKENTIKHVYKYVQGISNPEIKEIDNFVKVDFSFPGCPINAEEFLRYIWDLIRASWTEKEIDMPKIPDRPVCVECKKKGNRCLLLDKKPCFGPMILGGCDAVCPTARMMCQGCRGLRPGGNVPAMRATLKNMMTDEEFENVTEIYGLRDDIEKSS